MLIWKFTAAAEYIFFIPTLLTLAGHILNGYPVRSLGANFPDPKYASPLFHSLSYPSWWCPYIVTVALPSSFPLYYHPEHLLRWLLLYPLLACVHTTAVSFPWGASPCVWHSLPLFSPSRASVPWMPTPCTHRIILISVLHTMCPLFSSLSMSRSHAQWLAWLLYDLTVVLWIFSVLEFHRHLLIEYHCGTCFHLFHAKLSLFL